MVNMKYVVAGFSVAAASTLGALTAINNQAPMALATDALEVALSAPAAPAAASAGATAQRSADVEFCFPDAFAEGLCVGQSELLARDDEPVTRKAADGAMRPAEVVLAHPDDFDKPEQAVRTCRVYASLKTEGWGPLTTADTANDAEFLRYCGLVALARQATPARTSRFAGAALTKAELAAIPATDWPQFGEGTGDAPVIRDDPAGPRQFTGDTETLMLRIIDVAIADFDGDGVAERLVYIAGRARGGTAGFATFAVLGTDGKAVRMRPVRWR